MKRFLAIEEVSKYLIRDSLVRAKLAKHYKDRAPRILKMIAAGDPCVGAGTFFKDLMDNDARLYKRFIAKGSHGNYHIDIKGLGGVYVYSAPEFDVIGYFLSIDDASEAIVANWTDSLVSSFGRSYREPFINDAKGESASLAEPQSGGPSDAQEEEFKATFPRSQKKSNAGERVLDFYLEDVTGQVYRHSRFGPDQQSDISALISDALKLADIEVNSAQRRAEEIGWAEAARALRTILDVKKQISNLKCEIDTLKLNRRYEIEVDCWLREHGIADPKIEDFARMAKSLKPFFHHREASTAWDANAPNTYKDAYYRLRRAVEAARAKRSEPDEQ